MAFTVDSYRSAFMRDALESALKQRQITLLEQQQNKNGKQMLVNPLSSLFSDVFHAVNVGKVCVLCPKRCFMRVGGCQNNAISHSQFVSEG